ncbi:beta-galactosidase domain protein [Leptospira interrogans str. L1207]|nr:beta-galactosidase domain protein [Leptospira interrogans str. L1207]
MTAILGTPTAIFPPWLAKKFPDIISRKRWNSKDNWHQKTGLFFFT